MKAHFIVNPFSAAGRTGKIWSSMEPMVKALFPVAQFKFTERATHASELAEAAARSGADMVVSVGGDGTNNEVVNGLIKGKKAVNGNTLFASLPMGTGGDLIRSLGVSRDPKTAITEIREARSILADVGFLSFEDFKGKQKEHYFLNICSFGLSGHGVRLANQSSKRLGGKLSFMMASLKAIIQYHNRDIILRSGADTLYQGKVVTVVVGNGSYFGGGMHISPEARLNSGSFAVVLIGNMTRHALLRHFPKLYRGDHLTLPLVKSFRVQSLEATTTPSAEMLLDVDGEGLGRLPLKVECLPGLLNVVVGPNYRA